MFETVGDIQLRSHASRGDSGNRARANYRDQTLTGRALYEFRRRVPPGDASQDLQQAFARIGVVEFIERIPLGHCQRDPHVFAGHTLDRMALVQDGRIVRWQNAVRRIRSCLDRQVAKEECMIDDQNLRAGDTTARLVVKALVMRRALSTQTIVAIAGNLIPNRAIGRETAAN